MASRAVGYWRFTVNRMGTNRQLTTATTPKMKPISPTADVADLQHDTQTRSWKPKGDLVPIYSLFGMVGLAFAFAVHTATQNLGRSPSVSIRKKRREMVPEVVQPSMVMSETDRTVNKSFFRKVAHVQNTDAIRSGMGDHVYKVETLESIGVVGSGRR